MLEVSIHSIERVVVKKYGWFNTVDLHTRDGKVNIFLPNLSTVEDAVFLGTAIANALHAEFAIRDMETVGEPSVEAAPPPVTPNDGLPIQHPDNTDEIAF